MKLENNIFSIHLIAIKMQYILKTSCFSMAEVKQIAIQM